MLAIPGWTLWAADFSCQATGKSNDGVVTLSREIGERKRWHQLPESVKESETGPELFVAGRGKTFSEALAAANSRARLAKPIIF
jgi:hypothetical protein